MTEADDAERQDEPGEDYSDLTKYVGPAEAIAMFSPVFPPLIAKVFLMGEIAAGRIGVIGRPWVREAHRRLALASRTVEETLAAAMEADKQIIKQDDEFVYMHLYRDEFTAEYSGEGAFEIDLDHGEVYLRDPSYSSGGTSINIVANNISFRRETIQAYLNCDTGAASPVVPKPLPPSEGAPHRGRAGRPRFAYWDDMWMEVCRRILYEDWHPETQAEAQKQLLDWLTAKGETPSEDTMKRLMSGLYRVLDWKRT